ncbi:hypothetical protein [Carboxylicivirga taeanensis]|uniref:hypothetical protein n=1 Tax=Carboxylicivirga taeanensis TaxID=1416875 RepID=UPI003F6DD7D4
MGQLQDSIGIQWRNGLADYALEEKLVSDNSADSLISILTGFSLDTTIYVRYKAYELFYKKALTLQSHKRLSLIEQIVEGCHDSDFNIQLACIGYLKRFSNEEFNQQLLSELNSLLSGGRLSVNKEYMLLAGYLGFGKEQLQRRLLAQDRFSPIQQYWMHLALARMGEVSSVDYCLKQASEIKNVHSKVMYIVPQLIYTRQRAAVNHCIEMLYIDEKLCYSSDPDNNNMVCCGYRIMELLAPVIVNYPYEVDFSGMLIAKDYEEALIEIREWLLINQDYQLTTTTY